MASKPKNPEDFTPFRVAEESYRRIPRPEHAELAHAAGEAIAHVMVRSALLDSRGRRVKPVPMVSVSQHEPRAPRAYTIDGITVRHPMSLRPHAEFWGYPMPFEEARLQEPEELAVACAEALRKTFVGTPLWEPKSGVFHSSATGINYNDLALTVAERGAIQPEQPLSSRTFSEYTARVGGEALVLATGSQETGGTQMFPHTYTFVPKAQELRFLT